MNSRITENRIAGMFHSDELTEAVMDVVSEAKTYKKGASVWYIDPDGDNHEAKILSYDRKSGDYMIKVLGKGEKRVSGDELDESVIEAKAKYDAEIIANALPSGITDERDLIKAAVAYMTKKYGKKKAHTWLTIDDDIMPDIISYYLSNQRTAKKEAKDSYEIYHKTYSAATSEAHDLAKKRGFEVDQDSWFDKVNSGPKKPSAGKTNSLIVKLLKNGKPSKRTLVFQVYNREAPKGAALKTPYELNAYIG